MVGARRSRYSREQRGGRPTLVERLPRTCAFLLMPPTLSPRDLLELVAVRMTRLESDTEQEQPPIDITDFECWEWPQGVGLYALYQYAVFTDSKKRIDVLEKWFERRLREGLPAKNVNTMAPMLTLAHLSEHSGNAVHLGLCRDWAEWVMREMPRTEEEGLQHVVTGADNPQQLWADTLFMTVLFLAKIGVMLGRADYVDEALRQFLLHVKYLADRKTGLWFHGWSFDGRHNFAQALWARGNSWFTAGVVDFLETTPIARGARDYLRGTLASQVSGLQAVQAEDGMWHTLLDDRTSYVETSATAAFAYGILKGVRLGLLPPSAADAGWRAFDAVTRRIDVDGTVRDVSFGTPMGETLDHYRRIPQCPMAYGQALTLLLLAEAMRHDRRHE